MRDLRRLLKYLAPHWGAFVIATFAMLVCSVMETATWALIVPILNQVLGHTNGQTSTLFGLQRLMPKPGLAAWRMIALLLIGFTIIKGVAEYFSTYLMADVGQSSVLKLRQDKSAPIMAAFKKWVDDLLPGVPPKSALGKALAYCSLRLAKFAQRRWLGS